MTERQGATILIAALVVMWLIDLDWSRDGVECEAHARLQGREVPG